jgi:hypothetical protein
MFLTFAFLACQILSIVGSQIETKGFFSLTRILINIKRCNLQLDNLDTLIFLKTNWPNDPRIGCKSMEIIDINAKLEDKLKKIEGTFERDEILEMKFIIKNYVTFSSLFTLVCLYSSNFFN